MNPDLIKRYVRKEFNGWWIISMIGAAVILLPVLFIFFSIFQEPNENWYQIRQYLLKHYVTNTVILVVLKGLFTAFLGVTLAWLIAAYDFPLKKFFR
jgi:iron(III) transport system permease protein